MRVLVTGANGFIGQSVCHIFSDWGYEIIRVSRSFRESAPLALSIDLREERALEHAVQSTGAPDWVIHLAAVIPPTFEGAEAKRAAIENQLIDQNVFKACLEWRAGIVYASSASVYGFGRGDVKTESSLLNPCGPYGEAKVISEERGREWLKNRDLAFVALRISAPYGPNHHARTVLNTFVDRAMSGLPLLFHGTGSRQQDFIHVVDISRACLMAITHGYSGIYNIASGLPVTMRQLAELVVSVVPGCKSVVAPSGQEDPQEGVTAFYDIRKAQFELGWQPQISLESGIRAMVAARI